jgi:outer membrane protein assembly factor BamB
MNVGAGRGVLLGFGSSALLVLSACGSPRETEGSEATDETSEVRAPLGSFNVLTRGYDNRRTGANMAETTLDVGNVNPNQFGKVFELPVDDQVYAQVLYASSVSTPVGVRNVLYVATVNNSVYAFDADIGTLIWQKNFNQTGRPPRNSDTGACGGNYQDFTGNIGIVGTPAIDATPRGPSALIRMYFVTRNVEGGAVVQRIRGIDIRNGNQLVSQIVGTQVTVQQGSTFRTTTFDPQIQNQRAALTVAGDYIYVAWSAYCDYGPYHGWMMAYDTNLVLRGTFLSTPTGDQAGIWMGGAGPAVDSSGRLYATTGNGTVTGGTNFGESVVKLYPASAIQGFRPVITPSEQGFFVPQNFQALNDRDNDFGAAGPSLVPGTNLLVNGGKDGRVYTLDVNNLGGVQTSEKGFQAVNLGVRPGTVHHIHGSMVVWPGPSSTNLYVWGENDFLRAFRLSGASFEPLATGAALPPFGMPGGAMTLSSRSQLGRGIPGTGVLWAVTPLVGNANHATVPGLLRAYNAETLTPLWDSNAPVDRLMTLAKFNPPVVARGRVYVPTFGTDPADGGRVMVYGIKTPPTPISGGTVTTLQKRHSVATSNDPAVGTCIDVPFSAPDSSLELQTYTCNGTGAQTFQFNDKGNGQWEIRRNGTNLCFDIRGGSLVQAAAVQQFTCNGTVMQRFAVDARPGGVQLRIGSNLCVDVPGNDNGSGALLQLYPCNGTDAQVFTPLPPQIRKINEDNAELIEDGPVLCIDAPDGATTSALQLQMWLCNQTGAQNWQATTNPGGVSEIRRNSTNLCFDVPWGDAYVGAPVTQYACNGTAAQRWVLDPMRRGYQIRLDGTDLCVDIPGNSNDQGTQLQLYTCNQTNAQIFGL